MAKRGDTKLTVRFSKSLHHRLVQYARGNSPQISLQGAVEALLEQALGDDPSPATMTTIEQAARASFVQVMSDPEVIKYLIAKYPKFRAALVKALAADQ